MALVSSFKIFSAFCYQVQVTYGTLKESDPEPYRTPGVGRATEGQDFVSLLDSVVFLANQTEANITLRVLDDVDPERDESVFVKLISLDLIKGDQNRPSKLLCIEISDGFIFFNMNAIMSKALGQSSKSLNSNV